MENGKGLLDGVVVLDLGRVLACPYAAVLMADLGATVIKIENPKGGDDTRKMGPFINGNSVYYTNFNRSKVGITLNLKEPEGKEIFKELVKKGNITRITISRDGEVLLNLPLNAGIVGAIVAPWGVIAGVIAAFGFKCRIELTKDDGTVIDISQRAEAIGKEVAEKGSVVVDDVVAKGSEAYNNIKDAASDKITEFRSKKEEAFDDIEEAADALGDKFEDLLGKAEAKAGKSCEEEPEKEEDGDADEDAPEA